MSDDLRNNGGEETAALFVSAQKKKQAEEEARKKAEEERARREAAEEEVRRMEAEVEERRRRAEEKQRALEEAEKKQQKQLERLKKKKTDMDGMTGGAQGQKGAGGAGFIEHIRSRLTPKMLIIIGSAIAAFVVVLIVVIVLVSGSGKDEDSKKKSRKADIDDVVDEYEEKVDAMIDDNFEDEDDVNSYGDIWIDDIHMYIDVPEGMFEEDEPVETSRVWTDGSGAAIYVEFADGSSAAQGLSEYGDDYKEILQAIFADTADNENLGVPAYLRKQGRDVSNIQETGAEFLEGWTCALNSRYDLEIDGESYWETMTQCLWHDRTTDQWFMVTVTGLVPSEYLDDYESIMGNLYDRMQDM